MDGMGNLEETSEASGQIDPAGMALAPPAPFPAGSVVAQQNPKSRAANVETAIILELGVALLVDPPTQLTVIDVNNEEGVVTLTGEVDNYEVRRVAGEIASSYPGVASAVNDLQISSPGISSAKINEHRQVDEKEETNDQRACLY